MSNLLEDIDFESYCGVDIVEKLIDQNTNTINVYLNKGIYDDFTFDFGWTSSFIGATKGLWERGKPNPTNGGSAPGSDSPIDCGEYAFVTGNDPSLNPDKDEVKNIFKKFYRAPTGNIHNVKGFGIGLSYVEQIIKMHKGTIVVKSEKYIGSTFKITIPLNQET